jgi:hypothetical protein
MTAHALRLFGTTTLLALVACSSEPPPAAEAPPTSEVAAGAETSPPEPATPAPAEARGRFCGGIAAFRCPGEGVCVDNPDDGCDPARGGADCGGVCRCEAATLCAPGQRFDASPEVCACVSDAPPRDDVCARVRCIGGTRCISEGGSARCVPLDP